ncbi:MAG: ribonuclease H-like domain-containing protein [Lachnospiraceae bacterium]|nr:ribonuclease H-like domain-containing protein [Lachnospiraceae bacterium]
MHTETYMPQSFLLDYPLEKLLADPERILFLDIETTGFTAKSSFLYIIGCAYFENSTLHTIQWMAESYEQERDLLEAFFQFASRFRCLVHFNGNNFDIPYLQQKCIRYALPYSFDDFEGIDLYKRISPYKFFVKLPNCKQKTIEQYLGYEREDAYTGSELAGVYQEYVQNPTELAKDSLLLHNQEDLLGMFRILPILAYYDIFNKPVKVKKVQASSYTDYTGRRRQELIMKLALPTPLPVPVSSSANGCYFRGEGDTASLRVPIVEEELKYFYANYKDYYYLPEEDIALHKSVAGFVDKAHRIQASAATCYTRKYSQYLPQWEPLFTPFFKRDYKSKELFFELTDELKKDKPAFHLYAGHVLDILSASL